MKKMFKYLSLIFLIILLSFALPRIIPGSPLSLSSSDMYVLNEKLPEETFNAFKEYYAPEKSLYMQFAIYMKHLVAFDLGYSFYYKFKVKDVISGRILWTAFLSITSIVLSTLIGVPFGLKIALNKRKHGKEFIVGSFVFIQAIPAFILAVLFQFLFCFKFNIFPSSGAYSPGIESHTVEFYKDAALHSVLPLSVLIILQIPSILLLTYNVSSKVKNENFVKMAKYLNIDEGTVIKKFILRNSLPEILSKLNIQFLYAVSGTLFVEAVFSYPGMGMLLKIAASSNDYPLLQGILLIIGIYGLLINIIFEALIKKVTPRY